MKIISVNSCSLVVLLPVWFRLVRARMMQKGLSMPQTKVAFIACPKCQRQVSRAARSCPQCGHPIGIINWILDNKVLLLVTSLLGANGLWFINFFKEESSALTNKGEVSQSKPDERDKPKENKEKPKHTVACSICKNTGVCPLCHGKPRTSCAACAQSGHPGYQACDKCEGNKHLTCPACKGRGIRTGESKPCDKCRGKGKLPCQKCDSKGEYQCSKCYGRGYINCNQCGGTGKCIACSK
jgi:RNA polymerase subunit RPABC4/transcription elongation factor Spt4